MNNLRISKLIAGLAILGAGAGGLPAAVTVEVDMDTVTAGIQATRTAALNEVFTIALVMTADAAGVSSYGVSVNFDNVELTLNGAPASTETLPAGFTFNGNAGVNSESQALGQVRTFEAGTLGLGPVSSSFTIGTISFRATAPLTDVLLDVTPGLFNTGFDGIFDNSGNDVGAGAIFVGGKVNLIPEPGTAVLLVGGIAVVLAARRRRSARWLVRGHRREHWPVARRVPLCSLVGMPQSDDYPHPIPQ